MYKCKLKKQKNDIRDYKFHIEYEQIISVNLPDKINLYNLIQLPILDQYNLGSCTANVTSNAILFYLKQYKMKEYQPSRLYIYYFSRLLEGNINEDSGCDIRSVLKAISKYGVCDELIYPYNTSKFKEKPPYYCIIDAKLRIKKIRYLSIEQNLRVIKNCLYRGYPIILGVNMYESFEDKDTLNSGDIPIPDINIEKNLGFHCILLIGYNEYNNNNKFFIFINSWGDNVGYNGIFNIPYEYILSNNLASDFWAIDYIE
jgi:C1A family cysteine protease